MEGKENQEQVPEKIDNILKQLQSEQGQSFSDERSKQIKSSYGGGNVITDEKQGQINMEIGNNLQTLVGYAQLWEARPKLGTKEEGDQLMRLGFLKMKNNLYQGLSMESIDKGIDFALQELRKKAEERKSNAADSAIQFITRNRGVLHEENK